MGREWGVGRGAGTRRLGTPPPPRPGRGSGVGPAAGAEQRTRSSELRRGQLRAPRCPGLRHRPALQAEGPGLAPPAEGAVRGAPNCSSSPSPPNLWGRHLEDRVLAAMPWETRGNGHKLDGEARAGCQGNPFPPADSRAAEPAAQGAVQTPSLQGCKPQWDKAIRDLV